MMNSGAAPTFTGVPASWYFGLLTAPSWAGTTGYVAGNFVVITAFNSTTGSTGRLFKCTTGGTTAGTINAGMNAGTTAAGGTVSDGGVTWTEVTNLFEAQGATAAVGSGATANLLGQELPASNAYTRIGLTANTTSFPTASSAQPSVIQNGVAVTFPTPTPSNWTQVVGFIICDVVTTAAVNVWWWGLNSTTITPGAGSSPSFAINAVTLTLE